MSSSLGKTHFTNLSDGGQRADATRSSFDAAHPFLPTHGVADREFVVLQLLTAHSRRGGLWPYNAHPDRRWQMAVNSDSQNVNRRRFTRNTALSRVPSLIAVPPKCPAGSARRPGVV